MIKTTNIKNLFLVVLFMVFTSCSDKETYSEIDGNYTGFFEREGRKSEVSLNFNEGDYSGDAEFEKFPALCTGNYVVNEDTVTFSNQCVWTAEFDWSLILNGDWTFTFQNNQLILTNEIGDRYILESI